MKKLIVLAVLTLLSTACIKAQDAPQTENLIQYDPLFWKEKLKLDPDQCQKIREINGEYYENLFSAYKEEKGDVDALQELADKSLKQRNQEIWETFHPKQRKRWKRMWHASSSASHSNSLHSDNAG
jgi:hypothetical protein